MITITVAELIKCVNQPGVHSKELRCLKGKLESASPPPLAEEYWQIIFLLAQIAAAKDRPGRIGKKKETPG